MLAERKVVGGEADGGVLGLVDALAEQGDDGARLADGDGHGEDAAVLEGDVGGDPLAGAEFGAGGFGIEGHGEDVVTVRVLIDGGFGGGAVGMAGRLRVRGGEEDALEFELLDQIEAGSFEVRGGIAGVEDEVLELRRFGEGLGGDGLRGGAAVLLDLEVDGVGHGLLQRQGEGDLVGAVGLLPGEFGGGVGESLVRGDVVGDLLDAGGSGGGEQEVVGLAGDEGDRR